MFKSMPIILRFIIRNWIKSGIGLFLYPISFGNASYYESKMGCGCHLILTWISYMLVHTYGHTLIVAA